MPVFTNSVASKINGCKSFKVNANQCALLLMGSRVVCSLFPLSAYGCQLHVFSSKHQHTHCGQDRHTHLLMHLCIINANYCETYMMKIYQGKVVINLFLIIKKAAHLEVVDLFIRALLLRCIFQGTPSHQR